MSFVQISFALLIIFLAQAGATGISVDAGLTPAEDRWIVRMQYRQLGMSSNMHQMDSDILMGVLAYGITHDVTLMIKQLNIRRTMIKGGTEQIISGLSDLAVMGKFGLYRKNSRHLTLAVAPTIAVKMPTGKEEFSTGTWDVQAGIYGSWRSGRWGSDLNVSYAWTGFAGASSSGLDPGDETGLDAAFSHQFSIGSAGNISLTPVLEFTYRYTSADQQDEIETVQAGSIFFISPGLKYTWNSFILEFLVQFPASQTYPNAEQKSRILAGFRYMF